MIPRFTDWNSFGFGLTSTSDQHAEWTDSGQRALVSILLWLERNTPDPALLGDDLDRCVSLADRAMGVIGAMANIVTGTRA